MKIRMIGMDHRKAPLQIREMFSFTKSETERLMQRLMEQKDISGCVVLSTCNRLELWFSGEESASETAFQILFEMKNIARNKYVRYFVCRENEAAAKHLFLLAGGLKSQIIGEDQILNQIKEALTFARTSYCSDSLLEVLFRMAVTAGKQIKTTITIPRGNSSAAHKAIEALREQGVSFTGKKCLVIGNGEMGRLTALAVKDEGAEVTVTVRQYKSGVVTIPEGLRRINYGERYQLIPSCDFIFSATTSPNVTITREALLQREKNKPQIYIDLAVPRDIDPQIEQISGIQLYNMESFQIDQKSEEMRQKCREAEIFIQNKLEEFSTWYQCRELIPKLQSMSRRAADDVVWRTQKAIALLQMDEKQQKELEISIEMSAKKVINKLLFQIRDNVSAEIFRECLDAAAKAYPE